MNIEKLTCKQYIDLKMNEYKQTYYYKKVLELRKNNKNELAENIINSKIEKYKNEWYEYIKEYGRSNKLNNKIIYSFIREYGYNQLLYDFRRVKGLDGWIASKKYTLNQF